jgi:hypothetical protein
MVCSRSARGCLAALGATAAVAGAVGCGAEQQEALVTDTPTVKARGADARAGGAEAQIVRAAAGRRFHRLEQESGAALSVSLAPLKQGPITTLGTDSPEHAWSTMKVPLVVTLARGSALSEQSREEAQAALESSDNQAAAALFEQLEQAEGSLEGASRAIQDTLRRAGDDRTRVSTTAPADAPSTFGQTEWSARAATLFYRALGRGCLLGRGATSYVLSLMSHVEEDQRWGLGMAGYDPDTPLAFKGGWGPEPHDGYVVRQSGIVGQGHGGYVVSIVARLKPGGSDPFAAGWQAVTLAAEWVRHQANAAGYSGSAGC